MNKLYLTIGMLFSLLTIFSSCKSKGNTNNPQILIKQEFKSNKKTKLDSRATVIFRDKKENLWFLEKEKGVYKYDGKNLSLFTSDDGLLSYRIIGVQEDSIGNLYFDTPEGVFKYNGEKFSILPIVENKQSENKWKSEHGDLWFRIGWDKNGPYRFDGENLYRWIQVTNATLWLNNN